MGGGRSATLLTTLLALSVGFKSINQIEAVGFFEPWGSGSTRRAGGACRLPTRLVVDLPRRWKERKKEGWFFCFSIYVQVRCWMALTLILLGTAVGEEGDMLEITDGRTAVGDFDGTG